MEVAKRRRIMNEIEKQEIMAKAELYSGYMGHLDNAVKLLNDARAEGRNIYIEFNGQKLYSLLDDEDSCYMKVVGTTKKEYEQEQQRLSEEWEKKEKEENAKAQSKIPYWIEEGNKLIYPQMQQEWARCVAIRAGDIYHGAELDNALEIMKALDNISGEEGLIEAKKILDDAGHSGSSYGTTTRIIFTFSKRGPEFYRDIYLNNNLYDEDEKEIIEEKCKKKEEENAMFEEELEAELE